MNHVKRIWHRAKTAVWTYWNDPTWTVRRTQHYTFIADARHTKYGLKPGLKYSAVRDRRSGRTISKPILLGETPSIGSLLRDMIRPEFSDDVSEKDRILGEALGLAGGLILLAIAVVIFTLVVGNA